MASGNTLVRRKGSGGYLAQTRDPTNSLILVAPLFVIYQVGILFTDGWRNGADLMTDFLVWVTGGSIVWYSALNMLALAIVLGVYLRRRQSGALQPSTVPLLVLESSVYAFVAGGLVSRMLLGIGIEPAMLVPAGAARDMGVVDTLVLSIGAGTWEELVFRAGLMMGTFHVLRRSTKFSHWQAMAVAVLSSSFVFSAFHYWPFGMDPWELWSFSFRFLLGVAFAGLYLWRGLAVAVYTHAIYDIFVLLPAAILS